MRQGVTLTMLLFSLSFSTAALGQSHIPRDRCDAVSEERNLAVLYGDAPVDTVPQIVRPMSTFTEAAVITCNLRGNLQVPRRLLFSQVESGRREGYAYRVFYSDGSGSIRDAADADDILARSLWSFSCRIDSMTDAKSCMISRSDLYIHYYGSYWTVSVGANNYPGSQISIRIGDDPAITAGEPAFSREASARIVEQILREPRVRTRYSRWPTGLPEQDFDARGFALAVEVTRWVFDSLVIP